VTGAHAAYVAAGSEAVQTNTFGANPVRLAHFGLADRCAAINHRAVGLARVAGPTFVIGDIGPTGEYLPPVGDGDLTRWLAAFSTQARALADAGVDAIHVETMSDLREATAALEAVRTLAPDLPVMVSLTFERRPRGVFTVMGDRLVDSLRQLLDCGATVVGANCSIASGAMRELAAEALAGVRGRLVFQPNAGQPEMTADGLRYAQDPVEFAADLLPVIHAGAAAVGGCCGTDPRFITALRRQMSSA
jgi:5-methyltetrahydrofolate--homocysteine methyltransferase